MDKESLFKFSFGCDPSDLTENIIVMPFFPVALFKETGDMAHSFKGKLFSGAVFSVDNKKFTVIRSGMGDRFLGDAILLAGISPVKRAVFLGTCGGLSNADIGDLVIPDKAYNGEGFSRYYSGETDFFSSHNIISADEEFIKSTCEYFSKHTTRQIHRGAVFTIGSLVAEDKNFLKKLEDNNIIAIDMEMSAFFTSCKASGIKGSAVMLVSDLPLTKPLWLNGQVHISEKFKGSLDIMVSVVTDFIKVLI